MSMKTYLAQHSFSQTRVFNRIFTMEEMVAVFLRALLGEMPGDVQIVAGRPVKFAGEFADDTFGENRLLAAYQAAGFKHIHFAFEPEAAGYRFARGLAAPATVLIGDFGGGTSDFSIIRFEPGELRPVQSGEVQPGQVQPGKVQSLGHAGIGIAGDSFDYRIVDNAIAPLLGKGDTYNLLGNDLPVPIHYFSAFARWHRLSLMRTPRVLRDIEGVARAATHPERLRDLIRLIKDEVGYPLYQAVGAVKAALSRDTSARLQFSHGDFSVDRDVSRAEFEAWIAPDLQGIADTVDGLLQSSGLGIGGIDKVFLTGGTSFVPAVRRIFQRPVLANRAFRGVASSSPLPKAWR